MAGNANSGRKDTIWRDAIHRAVKRRDAGTDTRALERLADTLVATALEGDVTAMKEIGDRLDGKPVQQNEHKGDVTVTIRDEWARDKPAQ